MRGSLCILLVVLLFLVPPVHACSCALVTPKSLAESVHTVDAQSGLSMVWAFEGTFEGLQQRDTNDSVSVGAVFRPTRSWSVLPESPTVTIDYSLPGPGEIALCPVPKFTQGDSYLVVAYRGDNAMSIGWCNPSMPLGDADMFIAALDWNASARSRAPPFDGEGNDVSFPRPRGLKEWAPWFLTLVVVLMVIFFFVRRALKK